MKVEFNNYCFDTKDTVLIHPLNESIGSMNFKISFKNNEHFYFRDKENPTSLNHQKKLREYVIRLWMNDQELLHIVKIDENLKKLS